MADIFGYTKQQSDQIASSNGVAVSVAGSHLYLCQSVRIDYSRKVETQFELGSETAYVVAGHAQGTCTIEHLVGRESFLKPFLNGATECKGVDINIDSQAGTCSASGGSAICSGAFLQQVGINIQVGGLTVQDSAVFQFTSLNV